MMKKKMVPGILFLAALAVIVWAVIRYVEKSAADGRKGREKPPVVVNVARPERSCVRDERFFSGSVKAWSQFDVASEVAGKLVQLTPEIGDKVTKGDLIARIDDADYQQQYHQAVANHELAKAQYAQAVSLKDLRNREFVRQKELFQSGTTSIANYETAESALKQQTAIEAMRKAEVESSAAKLESAKIKLDDTKIFAEWDSGSGVRYVSARYLDEGVLLAVGTPVLNLVEIDRVRVQIPVIERDYSRMAPGMTARLTTDAFPGTVFQGTLRHVGSTLSENTRNAWLILEVPNRDLRLRPGMFVRVEITLEERANAVLLPVNALVERNGRTGVFTIPSENGVKFVPVTTGIRVGQKIEIREPAITLPVVTIGNHLLQDGDPIVISELSRQQVAERLAEEAAAAAASAAPAEK